METTLRFAQTIRNGFESYFADFQIITLAARPRFENADWAGVHAASAERIDLYKTKVNKVCEAAALIAGERMRDFGFWGEARTHYASLIEGHDNYEIAETFFNSIYCRALNHRKIRNEHAFVFSAQGDIPQVSSQCLWNSYHLRDGLEAFLNRMLDDYQLAIPYEDKARDVRNIIAVATDYLLPRFSIDADTTEVQVLDSLFFRNKGAYIVGRLVTGDATMPFALPILHTEDHSIYVDTVLFGTDRLSVIFSFTRSYFMVDAEVPSQYVMFLQSLMPAKPISEIYSAIGYYKHGKTYFHRCAFRHMQTTRDQFVVAPGIKGMVMCVFTLPSYDFVFKIIKDRFTPPKDMTREQVRAKYRLVKRADLAGRMADTQEFTNLAFARERFSDELMAELHQVAPSQIEEHGKALVIRHVYVERRMTPLNLYLRDATDEQVLQVMEEYGNAIKELAAANIFPGDMLLKNFGVTRHGRVVFYDYDELCPLTDCNFRTIPAPRNEEDEMASTPWYTVGEHDIFPEEFRLFFSGNQGARRVFDQLHSNIYETSFWKGLQAQISSGYVADFFPYRRKLRFPRDPKLQSQVVRG